MKKTHVAALNLKFMRIPLILCAFLSVTISCSTLSLNAPYVSLGKGVSAFLISSANSVRSKNRNIGLFSFAKVSTNKTLQSAAAITVSEPESPKKDISVTTLKTPISTDVAVSNSTDYPLDIKNFLTDTPSFLKDDFSVLILHTHTTESYTPSEKHNYIPSDTDRTLDKNFNMVRVGKEISAILNSHGIKAYHDTTVNDYPSYNGSYNKSALNVANAVKNDPSIKIILDIHRDAIESANGEKAKYACTIDGKNVASAMIVVGSNLSGLSHDNWKNNLNFAATLHSHIQSLYPGLMRPLNFRSQRFNQQLSPGAIIVEIGTNGNTLEEALLGAKYFAEGLSDYIEKNK